MRYSLVFLGAFMAATSLALPAPVPAPVADPSGGDLALRETSVQGAKDKSVVKKSKKAVGSDDTDTEEDAVRPSFESRLSR
jgi:hypothetical protein